MALVVLSWMPLMAHSHGGGGGGGVRGGDVSQRGFNGASSLSYAASNAESSMGARAVTDAPVICVTPKDEQRDAQDRRLAAWIHLLGVGTFTLVVVALASALLFWRQLRLMTRGANDAAGTIRVLADAATKWAELAEQSMLQLERPCLYATVGNRGFIKAATGADGNVIERNELELVIHNLGRRPASLTHLHCQLAATPIGEWPDPLNPEREPGRPLPPGTVAAPGAPFLESLDTGLALAQDDESLSNGRKSVWVVGFVRYADFHGEHQVAGFAQVLDRRTGHFVQRGDTAYNYVRSELARSTPLPRADTPPSGDRRGRRRGTSPT